MQIDRSNYEIWIIDWLDGNLNNSQVVQLNLFLDENPDLREEFNDLTHSKLLSPDILFKKKENLKKSPSDISQAQFEYLCAAYLENDLSISQKEEIDEIVKKNPERKNTFDQIHRTILIPDKTGYKHKNLLLKRTSYKKVIWLSVKGLSIAAAISLLIVVYTLIPSTTSSEKKNTAQSQVADSMIKRPSSEIARESRVLESKSETTEKIAENRFASAKKKINIITPHRDTTALSADTFITTIDNPKMSVEKVPVHSPVELRKGIADNTLVQSIPKPEISVTRAEKNHSAGFISKTFREKILRIKTPDETPVTGYEIAEAGVSGLNKLLGWEMALDMKKDENGQPKSVSFSSGILKIQAPVKKRDPQP
jgi:hypothetical protein